LFVQLSDIYVEGLVHITALKNDYYQFDPVRHQLRGERSGVTYHLGDTVRVKVVRVDLDDRKIELAMVDGAEPAGPGKAGSGKGGSGKRGSGKDSSGKGGSGKGGQGKESSGRSERKEARKKQGPEKATRSSSSGKSLRGASAGG